MATNLNADEVLINADKVYNFTANFDTDPALEKLIVQQLHKDSSLTSGTGTYIPFLNQNATGNDISSQGFNTSDAAAKANNNGKGLDMSNTASTTAIQLKDIPLVIGPDGNRYYEIRLDINEENNDHLDSTGQSNRLLELSEFQLYWSSRQATLADYDAANYTIKAFADSSTFHLAFDIDANTDRSIILRDSNPGGGKDDYIFYIPADTFEGASPDSFITLFSQFGPSPSEGATPEEWRIRTTSQIDGMKFEDKDSDQVKDGDENGVPGVTIQLYQDTGNGVLDASDYLISTTVTGAGGAFSFYSLLPGTYFVKEVVPAGAVVTTGEYETVIITTPGQDVSGVQIGNHYLTPHIDIQKSAEIDGDNDCADSTDETITYTITVTNDGELALSNVVVTDTFEGGAPVIIDDGDGTLEPGELVRSGDVGNDNILSVGETWTYTYNRAVTQADIDSNGLDGDGLLSNVAAVSATSANGSVNDSDGATVDVCQYPGLLIVKSAVINGGDDCVDSLDDVIHYTYELTNTGNVSLTGVVVEDDRLGVLTLQSGDDDNDGELDVGETWLYAADVNATQEMIDANGDGDGTITNVVTANGQATTSGEAALESEDTATVDVCQYPGLLIVKSAVINGGDDCVDSLDDVIHYTYELTNTGNVSLTGVVVEDDRLGVLTLQSGDDDNDGELDVGETWLYAADVNATQEMIDANGDGDGTITNVVTANGQATTSGEAALESEDTATVDVCQYPGLLIVKSAVINGGDDCVDSLDDVIHYTYELTNTGNVSLTGVVVEDDRLGVLTLQSGDDDNDGELDVGETWLYAADVNATQEMIDANGDGDGTITNVVTANGQATTSGEAALESEDTATVDVCQYPGLLIVKSAVINGGDDCVDSLDDVIHYTYELTNTGNVSLTGVVVEDDRLGVLTLQSGDDDNDGELDVGETWLYAADVNATQEMIDANGDGDGTITNVVTANGQATTSGEAALESEDTATVDVCQYPGLLIVKSAVINGGDDCVDSLDDVIHYTYELTNTGNVSLTGVVVEDDRLGVLTLQSGDDDNDGELDVGETWLYAADVNATQEMIDANGDGDGTITNVVTANGQATTSGEAALESEDTATVDVCQNPSIDVEKSVKTNLMADYTEEDYDDDPGDLQASTSTEVQFRVVVQNTGNVTLSNITLTDSVVHTVGGVAQAAQGIVYTPDGDNTTLDASNVFVDLDNSGDRNLDGSEDWINFDTDGDGTIDAGVIAELSPNESFTLYYSLTSEFGQHENTASVYGSIGADTVSDSDDANYYVLAEDCGPGVRTPGFWSNLGWGFWDGKEGLPKQVGQDGFADHEFNVLVYGKDTDNDGDIDLNDSPVQGLLIGDWNLDGIIQVNGADGIAGTADDEDNVLFISLKDAQNLINASNKDLKGDATFMLGRDVVATWLNYMAGNGIDNPGTSDDAFSPKHYLDEAIDWLQTWAGKNGNGSVANLADNDKTETFDTYVANHATVKNSTSQWQTAQFGDHSAAQIHSALDGYNNDGVINGVEFACDADNDYALLALSQIA